MRQEQEARRLPPGKEFDEPSAYIPLSLAGEGCYSSVYFCVPKEEAMLAQNLEALSKQIVAIKIVIRCHKGKLKPEPKTLKYIKQQANIHGIADLVSKVSDWHENAVQNSWLVISTWPVVQASDLSRTERRTTSGLKNGSGFSAPKSKPRLTCATCSPETSSSLLAQTVSSPPQVIGTSNPSRNCP